MAIPMERVRRYHFSHEHALRRAHSDLSFHCDGCHQDGIGFSFSCNGCGFNLHTQCADTKLTYDVYKPGFNDKCEFIFFPDPPEGSFGRCSACKQQVEGFVYSCRCGQNLHPCCAALPLEIKLDNGKWLDLCPKASGPCNHCGKIRESWSYTSDCKKYNFHVACVMEKWLVLREDNHEYRNWMEKLQKSLKKLKKVKKVWKIGCKLVAEELMHVILGAVLTAVFGDPTAFLTY